MNNYTARVIEKYLSRKPKDGELNLSVNESGIFIKEWNILDKTKPTEAEVDILFTSKEKEIYQDILIKELNNIYYNKFLQEIFDTWKASNTEYQAKLTKIMGATKVKLKSRIEDKVEL